MANSHFSRRQVLTASLLGGGSLLVSGTLARDMPHRIPWIAGASPSPRDFDGAHFLTADERRCVDALVGRLIPSDDPGPGAREAGVVDFIDNQLAGPFGRGERWYMKGPFAGGHFNPGSKEHGYDAANGPHAGDMPNQYVAADGTLRAEVLNPEVTLADGEAGIRGRALMIHAGADDYRSQPSGDAGERLACAVIE